MITLHEIIELRTDIFKDKKVKIIRHKDNRAEYRDLIKNRDSLLFYQTEQKKEVFKGCDYIISFVGKERRKSVLLGVFKVGKIKERKNGLLYYQLDEVSGFEDLNDRLVIDWGDAALAWHQWYHLQNKEVVQLLPKGYLGEFPGLTNLIIDFDELKLIVANPEANHEWVNHLSAVNGIYLILDVVTGNQYIGSAFGKLGIWQRWCTYAKDPTGGNSRLKQICKDDYHKNFRYSILQTLPSNMLKVDVERIEGIFKQKMGSRAFGLNGN